VQESLLEYPASTFEELITKPRKGWGFIYLISSPSGKQYVGQTSQSVQTRIRSHRLKPKPAYASCRAITNAFARYGETMRVSILEACPLVKLDQAEIEYITRLQTLYPFGYNLTSGGNRPREVSAETRAKLSKAALGRKRSPETCRRLSEAMLKRGPHRLTPEGRAKLCKALSERVITAEMRQQIRLRNSGRKFSAEARQHMSDAQRGRKLSPETLLKVREARKNRVVSEETRRRQRLAKLGCTLPRSTVQKIIAAHLGRKNTPETIQRMRDAAKRRCARKESDESIGIYSPA
jgi:group I intron endonuclease